MTTVYYVIYLFLTLMEKDDKQIYSDMLLFNLLDCLLTILGILLFVYALFLIRRAISNSQSYNFDTQSLWAFLVLWLVIAAIQITVMVTFRVGYNAVIYAVVVRVFIFFIFQCTLLYWVVNNGQGMNVKSTLLTTGQITFVGSDSRGKQIFTFTRQKSDKENIDVQLTSDDLMKENQKILS